MIIAMKNTKTYIIMENETYYVTRTLSNGFTTKTMVPEYTVKHLMMNKLYKRVYTAVKCYVGKTIVKSFVETRKNRNNDLNNYKRVTRIIVKWGQWKWFKTALKGGYAKVSDISREYNK